MGWTSIRLLALGVPALTAVTVIGRRNASVSVGHWLTVVGCLGLILLAAGAALGLASLKG